MKIAKFDLEQIKKIHWFKVVAREMSPFFNAMLRAGYSQRNKNLFFDNTMDKNLVIGFSIFSSMDDFNRLKADMISADKKHKNFIGQYIKTVERDGYNYLGLIKNIKINSEKKLSNEEMHKLFMNYINATCLMASHMWPPLAIEDYILDKIKNGFSKYVDPSKSFSEYSDCINILISSDKPSLIQLRKISILSLAIKLKNKSIENNSKYILREYEKYCWIDDRGLNFKYETYGSFIKDINAAGLNNPEAELKKIKNEFRAIKIKKNNIIKKYKLNERVINFIDCANDLPHIRFFRTDVMIESGYILKKNLFKKICIALNIKIDDFKLFYHWEILDALKSGKINRKNMLKRMSSCNFSIIENCFTEFDDKQSRQILKFLDGKQNDTKEIKGNIACVGKVTGRVKIILSNKEFSGFKNGDILVTSMTMPEYVPIMKKSSAIITDEGGLTCHAAIISRELNIPCIIGTRIATKVLKDGDSVEVDANRGIVKILNQK